VNTFIGTAVVLLMFAFVIKIGYDKIINHFKPKKEVQVETVTEEPIVDEKVGYRAMVEAMNENELASLSYEAIDKYGKYKGDEDILKRWSTSNNKCYHCGGDLKQSIEDIPHYDANHDYVEYVRENVECLKCKNCGRLIY